MDPIACIDTCTYMQGCIALFTFVIRSGGWVGYFSYDTVRYVEKKKLPFSSAPHDDRNLPDVHLGLYDNVIVFDHVEKVCL